MDDIQPVTATYQTNVVAEENLKERTLSRIKKAARVRSDSELTSLCAADDEFFFYKEEVGFQKHEDVRNSLFDAIPEPCPYSKNFQRVHISQIDEESDHDTLQACKFLKKCLDLRHKWQSAHPKPPQDAVPLEIEVVEDHSNVENIFRRRDPPKYDVFGTEVPSERLPLTFEFVNGVAQICSQENPDTPLTHFSVFTFDEFLRDFNTVRQAVYAGPSLSYSYKRLEFLLAKFNLHVLLNSSRELDAQKSVPHRDFYNIRKVDTHVHHSACMHQKHLLRFIKSKLRNNPNEIVVYRDGKFLTLGEVFTSLHLTAYDLSIDTLDMHADNTFHRFDRFNLKYNPAGQSRLREIFLKTDNVLGGRYLAELTKEVIADLEASKYQLAEWRISIYGRKESEWDSLAQWFYTHRLAHPNIRWLIQIPRLFHLYREAGDLNSFGDMLHNIFAPLFAVSIDPSSNPPLHYFLQTVVGFDSVDDESRPEHGQLSLESEQSSSSFPTPGEWSQPWNPPYGYWMYYLASNILVLNKLRAERGLCTFQFRPHCGEAGDVDHLISTYLVAHEINHGIQLRQNAALQYLYYLSQIGIAVSPLSNNKLFLDYNKNPFPKYFRIGMNVSLSTDDPLMLHYTKDALLEEYSVAAQVWKLSSTDQCEIARYSVLQSGWEDRFKKLFLGEDYCDIRETNVPEIRLSYRKETLDDELNSINRSSCQ